MKGTMTGILAVLAGLAIGCGDDGGGGAGTPAAGSEKVTAPGSQTAWASVAGDFNGDGRTDLAVLHAAAVGTASLGTVSVFYGPIPNTAAPLADEVHAVPPTAKDVAAGDWDSDGVPDLAVALEGDAQTSPAYPGSVHLLYRMSGGSLKGEGSTLEGFSVRKIATADFDGDGRADLMATGAAGTRVVFGTSQGSFVSPQAIPSSLLAAAGDFDGRDGADVAVGVSGEPRRIAFYRWSSGSFEPAGTVILPANIQALAAADLSGAERTELLVGTGGSISILAVSESFEFAVRFQGEATNVQHLAAGNFDGEWQTDFATVEGDPSNSVVSILSAPTGYVPSCSHRVTGPTTDLDAADLDGDGKDEMIVCVGSAAIYFPAHCAH